MNRYAKPGKLKPAERQRNTVIIEVTDAELETLTRIIAESAHSTRAEWLRAAIESYAGVEIFRTRREKMNRK